MIFDIHKLKNAMDDVRNHPNMAPSADGSVTHCNSNAFLVCAALGVSDIWTPLKRDGMMANDMVEHMEANPDRFFKFCSHLEAWQLASEGNLVFATIQHQPHGHICPLYPSVGMVTSGKWNDQVPYCSNVGEKNDIMGVNYAFGLVPPDYWLVL